MGGSLRPEKAAVRDDETIAEGSADGVWDPEAEPGATFDLDQYFSENF